MKRISRKDSKPSPKRRKLKGKAKASPSKNRQILSPRNGNNGSSPRCPKCRGFLVVHHSDVSPLLEIRCINCGWQPQLGTRIVGVNQETHSIRKLTSQMFFQPSLRLSLLSDKGGLEQFKSLRE